MIGSKVVLLIFGVFLGCALAQDDGACPPGNPVPYWPHQNCTLFYVCRPGGGVLLVDFCPSGLYWQQSAISCSWPYDVPECVGGTRPPVTTTTAITSTSTTTPSPPPTTTIPTSTTTPPTTTALTTTIPTTSTTTRPPSPTTPCPTEEICPPGSNFWKHENCTMYYICMGAGDYYLLLCPPGYFFNPTWDSCDLPVNVPDCGLDGTRPPVCPTTPTLPTTTAITTTTPTTTPPPTTTRPTTTMLTTTPTTTTPPTTTRPPSNGCPAEGVIKIPHDEMCDAFWLCIDGVRQDQLFTCPSGLLFDSVLQKCNLPSEVTCNPELVNIIN